MADHTKIEWTDATWNPVTGCTKVSAGCKHCYAERDWARLSANPKTRYYGRAFTNVQCHTDVLDLPLRWKRPRRIFVNSMSDLFHDAVPDEFIADVFRTMAWAHQHVFQVLTKRPDRMRRLLSDYEFQDTVTDNAHECADWPWPLANVWLGVSVEDQAAADERIPLLLQTSAAVRWISAEPLLGPVDLDSSDALGLHALGCGHRGCECGDCGVDWVVVGGESGPRARPMSTQWARSLRDQCAAAGVPFLFKQWGEWAPAGLKHAGTPGRFAFGDYEHEAVWTKTDQYPRSFTAFGARSIVENVGKKSAGRLLDGKIHDGYPQPSTTVSLTGKSSPENFVKEPDSYPIPDFLRRQP